MPLVYAGVPEPSIVLYGSVLDEQGQVLTTGNLSVTYTPSSGTPVTVPVALQGLKGPSGDSLFSYMLEIPCELALTGSTASATTLSLSSVPVAYIRSATLDGTPLVLSAPAEVSVSSDNRGAMEQLDFCAGCSFTDSDEDGMPDFWENAHDCLAPAGNDAALDPDGDGYTNLEEYLGGSDPCDPASTPDTVVRDRRHSADYGQPYWTLTLDELQRFAELFEATPEHFYHCDDADPSGYAPGPGAQSCAPHTADYSGGPDWRISLREYLRVADLLNSSQNGQYCVDNTKSTEDAFTAFGCGSKSIVPVRAGAVPPVLDLSRVVEGNNYVPGATLDITVTLDLVGDGSLTALGVTETLPSGWTLAGVFPEPGAPEAVPPAGSTGALDFAWTTVPVLPAVFSYRVNVPAGESGVRQLSGQGISRILAGGEVDSTVVATPLTAGIRADFWAYPNLGTPPLRVKFSGYALPEGVTIGTWTWDFGDGSPMLEADTNAPVYHEYTQYGDFTVTLTIIDPTMQVATRQYKDVIHVVAAVPTQELGGFVLLVFALAAIGALYVRRQRSTQRS